MKSREDLEKIFERISKQFHFENAHLELATDNRNDALINFIKRVFVSDEPINMSIGLECDEEMVAILRHMLRDNISILLISDIDDKIIAVKASYISRKEEMKNTPVIENEKLSAIFKFLTSKDKELNAFERYGVDVTIRLFILAVDKKYRQQGIASKLMKIGISFCSEIGLHPVVLRGEGTSDFSKAIFDKFEFETLHELVYEDYKVDNKVVFNNTGIHKSAKIYAKQV